MELFNLYQEYTAISEKYSKLLESLVEREALVKEESIAQELGEAKSQLESIMEKSNGIQVDEENIQNLKDLQYLATDLFFLAMDLHHFYTHDQMGRFQMRVINYLNKKRRGEMFG